jgi:hypothetical protein
LHTWQHARDAAEHDISNGTACTRSFDLKLRDDAFFNQSDAGFAYVAINNQSVLRHGSPARASFQAAIDLDRTWPGIRLTRGRVPARTGQVTTPGTTRQVYGNTGDYRDYWLWASSEWRQPGFGLAERPAGVPGRTIQFHLGRTPFDPISGRENAQRPCRTHSWF